MSEAGQENVFQRAIRVALSQPGLSAMMFLQYAIWGAWQPPLSEYVGKLGYSGVQVGWLYATLPIAAIFSPFTAGQVADRWLPAQIALAIFQLAGGAVLLGLAFVKPFPMMFSLLLLYSLLYAPTLALTNTLALRNIEDPQRDFGAIRVWGTIGWIAAGLLLSFLRQAVGSLNWAAFDAFILAGVMSLMMGVLSFFLPHTPPAKEAADPMAFRRAFVLLKNPNYLIFFIVAFIVATELQLYYVLTFPYLAEIGKVTQWLNATTVPAWMTIAQLAEIFVLAFLLPYALPRWGVRTCMLIGILAWPIRYIVFAIAWPTHTEIPAMVHLTVASLALHGFCYVFFFVVAFIYTDMVAPPDIRASAQALINVAVLGVGLLIGSLFAGFLRDYFETPAMTTGAETQVNWFGVFMVPAVITFLTGILFWALFRERNGAAAQAA